MQYKPTGITEQLAEYIVKNLEKGYHLDALKYSLMNQGYSKISVEKAIEIANRQIAEQIPPIKEKPEITYKIIAENQEPVTISNPPQKKGFFKSLFE